MNRAFLVFYDYGQGGVWGYVLAASKQEILSKYPELEVVDQAPSWMSAESLKQLEGHTEAVDHPGDGLLGDILKNRSD
jgi:hypothetical protein